MIRRFRKLCLAALLCVAPALTWAAAVIENSEAQFTGFGTSVNLTLGFSPTAGNTLVVGVLTPSQQVTAVQDNNTNAFTLDNDANSDGFRTIWRLSDIGSGVTGITLSLASATTPYVYIWEVSGLANSSALDDTVAWTELSFSASQSLGYTTDTDGQAVFAVAFADGNRTWTGTSGTTAITHTGSTNRAGLSKIAGTAGAGTINWDFDTAIGGDAALVTYRAASGGGDSTAPTCSAAPVEHSDTDTTVTVDATCSDETDSTVAHYWNVTPNDATDPTAEELRTDTYGGTELDYDATCSATSNGAECQVTLTGLSANTAYDVFHTVCDSSDNCKTVVQIDITTDAAGFAAAVDDASPVPGATVGITASGGTGGNIASLGSPDGTTKNVEAGANATTASWINWAKADFVSGGAAQNVEWAASGSWTVSNGTETDTVTMQIDPPDTDGPDEWFLTATTPSEFSRFPEITVAGDEVRCTREAGTNVVILANGAVSGDDDWEVTCTTWDESANGGNGQWSESLNTVLDSTPPSGYSVSIDQASIDNDNDDALSFTFAGAEVGADYDYSISSSGGGTPVTGSGTISTATDQITGIDVTALPDGILTLAVTQTDPVGNEGAEATDTVVKDTTSVPSGYTVTIGGATYNADSCPFFDFVWSGAEIGATYGCAVTSSGGAGSVAINGTIASADQEEGAVSVCGLPDGTLTLTCALTNSEGTGSDATDTATLDDTLPTLSSATVATDGDSITLAFSEAVTGQGGWTVSLAGVTLTYSSGDGTDSHVYTTSRTIGSHETLTISAAAGTVEDDAGNDIAAVLAAAVANNSTVDTVAPEFVSASISTAGVLLTLTTDEAITQGAGYADTDLTLACSGGAATLSYDAGDGTTTPDYDISRTIGIGEVCTLEFDGSANSLEDAAGNDLAAFDEPVTNSSTQDITAPTIQSARIDGAVLTWTLTETMFAGAGGTGGATLTCSGGAVTPTYDAIAGAQITFDLSREPANDETCTTGYTQPGNGFEDGAGNDLATFADEPVSFPADCAQLIGSVLQSVLGPPVHSLQCAY